MRFYKAITLLLVGLAVLGLILAPVSVAASPVSHASAVATDASVAMTSDADDGIMAEMPCCPQPASQDNGKCVLGPACAAHCLQTIVQDVSPAFAPCEGGPRVLRMGRFLVGQTPHPADKPPRA